MNYFEIHGMINNYNAYIYIYIYIYPLEATINETTH